MEIELYSEESGVFKICKEHNLENRMVFTGFAADNILKAVRQVITVMD